MATLARTALRHAAARALVHRGAPVRIDFAGGIGRPRPKGIYRDGVDLVAKSSWWAARGVKGNETRIFEAAGPQWSWPFTLSEP